MKQVLILPAEGKIIIDPATGRALPKDGKITADINKYWRRRIKDGDVTLSKITKTKTENTKQSARKKGA